MNKITKNILISLVGVASIGLFMVAGTASATIGISAVATKTTATISWRTPESLSVHAMFYGISAPICDTSTGTCSETAVSGMPNTLPNQDVSVTVTGLTPNTTYNFSYIYQVAEGEFAVATASVTTEADNTCTGCSCTNSCGGGGGAYYPITISGTATKTTATISWKTAVDLSTHQMFYGISAPICDTSTGTCSETAVSGMPNTLPNQDVSVTVTGLTPNTTYNFSYIYQVVAGEHLVATASVKTEADTTCTGCSCTNSCSGGGGGGGGGGGAYYYPSNVSSSISIENGAEKVTTTSVTLYLFTSSTATEMLISNSLNFENATWKPYTATTSWVLTAGQGEKTVYAKFKIGNSETLMVSDSIIYEVPGIIVPPVITPPIIIYKPVYVPTSVPSKFNVLDFNQLMVNWGEKNNTQNPSDLNSDAKVDFYDVIHLFFNWVDINVF